MKRTFRILFRTLLGLLFLLVIAMGVAYALMRASLPVLDGSTTLAGVSAPVSLTRDALGTVTIKANTSHDAMRALGFVHAQERFFEMDLTRRSAAGELSALLGKATIEMDKKKRMHRFRARMADVVAHMDATQRAGFDAYVAGVNAGLTQLSSRPWQYWLLRAEPEPWRVEDSMLVMCEMFYMLQAKSFDGAFDRARLRDAVAPPIFDWLQPIGGQWDAALDGSVIAPVTLPNAAELDVRNLPPAAPIKAAMLEKNDLDLAVGSNAWAIGGARTAHGGGMLADDMHLSHSVPNIWFRTQFEIGGERIAGVTLPGVASMVAGSNGHIAWGFTNSYGKWFDWIATTEEALSDAASKRVETIVVKGGDPISLNVIETPAGPVLRTVNDQSYALSWLAHDSEAINANLAKIMFAKNVDEGMVVAQTSGMPHQNFHIVDKSGNVAWTIAGKIPTRGDDAKTRKWLNAADYPVVRNPPNGRTWTGNNRQLGGAGGALIGEGGPDLGARAQQIRDRLLEKDVMSETDLHAIQLDNEARFLNRWAALATVTASSQKNSAVLPILRSWTLRADADQVGYRVARSFRLKVMDALWASWLSAAAPKLTDKKTWDGRFEYASWRALEERPIHLLPQPHKSWDEFLQHSLDATVNELITNSGSLEKATWGARNTTRIAHPFSRVIPALSSYLDMPAMPISGDNHMPKVAGPSFGQSQRLVVSPGREQDGILSMPGGQSGHPLSPFYGAGHSAWLRGEKTPLLAGTPLHTLVVSAPQ